MYPILFSPATAQLEQVLRCMEAWGEDIAEKPEDDSPVQTLRKGWDDLTRDIQRTPLREFAREFAAQVLLSRSIPNSQLLRAGVRSREEYLRC